MVLRTLFGRRDDGDDGDDAARRQRGAAAPAAPAAQPAAPGAPFPERMRVELERVRWMGRGAGATLPIQALPLLGEIEDQLAPLLSHLERHPPNAEEEFAVQALLTDYVPSTLRAFIGLAPQVAQQPAADGRTPGDLLLEQLGLLASGARDLATAVYTHDAQELATQGRFLSAKFEQSDLAL